MKNNASLIYNFFLVVGDFFALLAAFIGAYLFRVTFDHRALITPVHARTYLSVFLVLLPFWILIFALLGLYDSNIYEKRFSELGRLLVGTFIGMLFVVFWNFIAAQPILPARSVPVLGFVFGFIFIVLFRNIARSIRTVLFSYRFGLTNVLIIGNTNITDELVNNLFDSRRSGYKIVGVVTSNDTTNYPTHINRFSSFKNALEVIDNNSIHSIIQTELYPDENKNREILDFSQANHIGYKFVPGNTELFVGNIDVELFRSSMPVIAVHQTALFGWGRIAKRVFDIFVSLIALIVALPFMLVIYIIFMLFDRGEIIYKDSRLTRYNTVINIYKFRSMKRAYNAMSPEAAFEKMGKPELAKMYRANGDQLQNDPRISRFGHFLRHSSLDELPQLINILKGDISLVGPRALATYELAQYPKKNLLLSVKSGLTGLAQVSGRRDLSFEERRKLDLYYVQNWSFWLDITILIKTIRSIIGRQGAA